MLPLLLVINILVQVIVQTSLCHTGVTCSLASSPTLSPTTLSPTQSPVARIVTYLTDSPHNSNFGSHDSANALCVASSGHTTYSCVQTIAALCYSSEDTIANMSDVYSMSDSAPVYDDTSALTFANWSTYYTSQVSSGRKPGYWTGCWANGSMGLNCNGWTSTDTSVSGNRGNYGRVFDIAYDDTVGCGSVLDQLLCACFVPVPTFSPTPAPTPHPTTSSPVPPTTLAPTFPDSQILLYTTTSIHVATDIGNRSHSTALCQADAGFVEFGCNRAVAFLCYSGGDDVISLPNSVGFSSTIPVVYAINQTTAQPNWAAFVHSELLGNGTFQVNFVTAGVSTNRLNRWAIGRDVHTTARPKSIATILQRESVDIIAHLAITTTPRIRITRQRRPMIIMIAALVPLVYCVCVIKACTTPRQSWPLLPTRKSRGSNPGPNSHLLIRTQSRTAWPRPWPPNIVQRSVNIL